jgi:hypothetical protein
MVRKNKINACANEKPLIINVLYYFSFAGSFARVQTSAFIHQRYRLRCKSIFKDFTQRISLFFSDLISIRLQYRLQSYQLRLLICLQDQEVFSLGCKEKSPEDQSIDRILFAGLFATHSN